MAFRSPDLKRAIKVAHDMGLDVVGYEISATGDIRIQTAQKADDAAEVALNQWMKRRNG